MIRTRLALPVLLALAACGSSDSADEKAQADNVEMPAEEAMAAVDASAMAVEDPAALPGADATMSPAPEESGADPVAAGTAAAAAEAATKAAEKKM